MMYKTCMYRDYHDAVHTRLHVIHGSDLYRRAVTYRDRDIYGNV
jgi:hypothetical protein